MSTIASRRPAGSPEYLDLLKLTPQEHQAMISLASEPGGPGEERRKQPRLPATGIGPAYAEVAGTASTPQRFIVYPTDISPGGHAFLHCAYLHQDTLCRVRIEPPGGEPLLLEGKVVRCRLLRGRVHEVGVKHTTRLPDAALERLKAAPDTPKTQGPAPLAPSLSEQLAALAAALDSATALAESIGSMVKAEQPPEPDEAPAA